MSIKELLVECYKGHGIDFMTACQYATQFLAELRQQKPGTTWTIGPNKSGQSVTVRRD
jgi:hypothetical protein